jgi:hypothetical protein
MSNVEKLNSLSPRHHDLAAQWEDFAVSRPEHWSQLVEQIVQLEELIADLREDREAHSAVAVRKLNAMLKEKRTRLKAIDVGG